MRMAGLGKFEGQPMLAEIVYRVTLDGCCEETGSVDQNGHYAYVEDPITWKDLDEEAMELIGDSISIEELDYLLNPEAWIVFSDSQGFVQCTPYESKDEADLAWGAIEADQVDFERTNGDEEE